MGSRAFDLSATVPVPPGAAIDFLMDLAHHQGLHPFLVSAEVVANGDGADGAWWDWSVLEKPRLGPFRWPLRFGVRMVRTGAHSMQSHVRAAPGCLLASTTTAGPAADGSLLHEATVVSAPAPVLGYMTRQAWVAHTQTYERLPVHLADRDGGRMDP